MSSNDFSLSVPSKLSDCFDEGCRLPVERMDTWRRQGFMASNFIPSQPGIRPGQVGTQRFALPPELRTGATSPSSRADAYRALYTPADIRKASAFSACQDSEAASDIRQFLADQAAIKVVVGQGGGYGHQQAAVTGMQRLVELGFKGTFKVALESTDPSIRSRLDFLLKSNPQIKVEYLDRDSTEHHPIGFCFASDAIHMSPLHSEHHVDRFVSLSPTDWTPRAGEISGARQGTCRLRSCSQWMNICSARGAGGDRVAFWVERDRRDV